MGTVLTGMSEIVHPVPAVTAATLPAAQVRRPARAVEDVERGGAAARLYDASILAILATAQLAWLGGLAYLLVQTAG